MLNVAIYARVSTADQDCARQLADLSALAARRGFHVVAQVADTISGTKMRNGDRSANQSRRRTGKSVQRDMVLALARQRKIDAILVTELSRFGRSTIDLLDCLGNLSNWGVSLLTSTGLEFDFKTPAGKLLASLLAAFAEFERDLIADRTRSALARLKTLGVPLGRQVGQCPSDKHASAVLESLRSGASVNATAKRLGLDRRTVSKLAKRHIGINALDIPVQSKL